jgi:hypothetical protein
MGRQTAVPGAMAVAPWVDRFDNKMAAGSAPNPVSGIVRFGGVIRKAFSGGASGKIDASADKAGILDRIGMGAVLP